MQNFIKQLKAIEKKFMAEVNTSAKMTTQENNLLPQDFAASIQEMSLKDAVQFRSMMRKGVLTPLLGWQSKDDRATTAAVQQALYAVEQAIENKANEE